MMSQPPQQRSGEQQPSSPPGYTNQQGGGFFGSALQKLQQGRAQQGMTPQGMRYGMSNKAIPSMMGQGGGGGTQQGLIQALRGKMGQARPTQSFGGGSRNMNTRMSRY